MSRKRTLTDWRGLPDDFSIEEFEGFVYLIVNVRSNRKYIGRKYFWSRRKQRPPKGKSRGKRITKESDWRVYKGSCPELSDDIEKLGQENFEFHILSLHNSRGATNYEEIRQQFKRDVLVNLLPSGEFEYYNTNILGRYFRGKISVDL